MARLTNKQRVFLEAYLATWNASEAARRAGYADPRSQGSRMLTNVDIQAAINARIAELAMSANEVLVRITEHGRSSMADFLVIGEEEVVLEEAVIREGEKVILRTVTSKRPVARLDLDKAAEAGKLHLVKKYTLSEKGALSLELYDQQAALVHLGKHHGLFVERYEHSGTIDISGAREQLAHKLAGIVAGAAAAGVPGEPD